MANTSNDSYFSVTDSGAAISSATTYLQKDGSDPSVIYVASGTTTKQYVSGIALSDFTDTNYQSIDIAYNPFDANNGVIVGAISRQFDNAGATNGYGIQSWKYGTTYNTSTDPYLYYYDGKKVAIYKVLSSFGPSYVSPDQDSTHFSYIGQSFKVRLVPAENSYIPDLAGNERFKHYIVCYPMWVNSGSIVPGTKSVGFAAANYGVAGGWNNNNGTTGLQNAVVVDGTNSNNTLITNINCTVATTSVTCSYYSTYQKIMPNTKVRIKGLLSSGVSVPFTVSVTSSSTVGFSGTIDNLGAYSGATSYNFGDYVTYSSYVYYNYSPSGTTGVLPTDTTKWKRIIGTFSGTADPVIDAWNVYLETDFFKSVVTPVPASSNASAIAAPLHKPNTFKYNSSIINQKQTLFTTGDYLIVEGFPFDKDSITGGSINITAGILNNSVTPVSRPNPFTTVDTALLPSSDNRWIPDSTNFSSSSTWSSLYQWSSHNGSTMRRLSSPGDANRTYLPDLLDGIAGNNPKSNSIQLKLMSPDVSIPPMIDTKSVSFANQDLFYTESNPFKIDGTNYNEFTSLMCVYLDYIPAVTMNSTLSAEETNWYGIMSEAKTTGSWAADKASFDLYKQTEPRLSVRYRYDGTITLNLGDTVLTAIKVKNGISRPFQPIIVGLTVIPPAGSSSVWGAVLTAVDTDIHRSKISFTRNWLGATPVEQDTLLYGVAPFNANFHGAKMYVLEINHYYQSHSSDYNAFYNNEIKKIDNMYAVTSGRD